METGAAKVKLIADVAVFAQRKVLLVKYKDSNKYDHQQGLFLPDDVIAHGEHPDDAATRILSEQLNLDGSEMKLHHIESFTGNDSSWHLVFHYEIYTENMSLVDPSSEIQSAHWFSPEALPDDKEIAHHGWAKQIIQKIVDNPI